MMDKGRIVKPDSGNLVEDVLEAIEKYVGKPNLKARRRVRVSGSSSARLVFKTREGTLKRGLNSFNLSQRRWARAWPR